MIERILEAEVMDAEADAADYDAMDHSAVNATFAADFLSVYHGSGPVLDVGTGTVQIPVAICSRHASITLVAIDLAEDMLKLGWKNITAAGFEERITLRQVNASQLPDPSGSFDAVISNSIIHHIPEPGGCFAEMARVCRRTLFVRDLLRPDSLDELQHLVKTYAADANDHQRQLFADSLHAALTLAEVRAMVVSLGFSPNTVQATSDRHWTWHATV